MGGSFEFESRQFLFRRKPQISPQRNTDVRDMSNRTCFASVSYSIRRESGTSPSWLETSLVGISASFASPASSRLDSLRFPMPCCYVLCAFCLRSVFFLWSIVRILINYLGSAAPSFNQASAQPRVNAV